MKHIVFVIGNYKNGGVAMHATNLANKFAKNGYSSTLLVTKEISKDIFFDLEENISLISLDEYVSLYSKDKAVIRNKRKRYHKIRYLKFLRYLSKYIPSWDKRIALKIKNLRHGEKISVFAVNNPGCIYIAFGLECFEHTVFAVKDSLSKVIYAERTTPEIEFPPDEFFKEQFLKHFKRADKIILQTQNSANYYNGRIGNYTVINNPIKAGLPVPYNRIRRNCVTTFCRISKEKNLPLLLDAFIEFHKTYPEYTLEIYGNTVEKSEEELKKDLDRKIVSMHAEDFIKILPPRSDVHNVVRDCAMFVSSSDFEGLSNSMIEAMAIGLPCICTDCIGGGAREVITDGKNGLLVPIKDKDALCKAMCRIADDKLLSEKCSENATKIREDLSVDKIAEKWLEIIKNI